MIQVIINENDKNLFTSVTIYVKAKNINMTIYVIHESLWQSKDCGTFGLLVSYNPAIALTNFCILNLETGFVNTSATLSSDGT